MKANEKLRHDRLVFYKDDIEVINRVLSEFLRLSGAKCALLIDKEGHMVTKQGEVKSFDMDTISALVAGSFAATKEMAKLLGEEHFTCLFHQGERDNIQLSLVGDRTLLTVMFDDRTTVGMVRLYSGEACKKLVADLRADDGAQRAGRHAGDGQRFRQRREEHAGQHLRLSSARDRERDASLPRADRRRSARCVYGRAMPRERKRRPKKNVRMCARRACSQCSAMLRFLTQGLAAVCKALSPSPSLARSGNSRRALNFVPALDEFI